MSLRPVLLPFFLGVVAGAATAAEPSNIAILPPKPHAFGFLTRSFQQRAVPPANFGNSPRIQDLFRGGNLYLTALDVIALTLENNIDIETQRYGPLLAQEDLRRAQVGGALRNPTTPVAAGPQSVSLAGINISTSLASGSSLKVMSITASRLEMPICGAARPTPCAAYMDSNMSSASFFSSPSKTVTGSAGLSSTGLPNFTIG